jgi:hypothetical protein
MRNMLAFLAALVLAFVGLGWYLGWYTVHTAPAPSGHRSLTVDIDAVKIGSDLQKAEQKLQKKLAEKGRSAQKTDKKPAAPPKAVTPAAGTPDASGPAKAHDTQGEDR